MDASTGFGAEGAAERAAQKDLTERVGTRLTRRSSVRRLKWSRFRPGAKSKSNA